MAKQYKVGIYCRLSVDDASNSAKAKGYIPSDESVSIENQYEILSKFVMLNGWIEVKTYQAPKFEGGADYAVQQGAGMVIINKSDAQVEAAARFLKWFTQSDWAIEFSVSSGYLPVTVADNDMAKIEKGSPSMKKGVRKSLNTAVQTVKANTLYTTRAFETGTQARKKLEYAMSDAAQADRAAVGEALQGGATLEEATAEFVSEERFDTWYTQLMNELSEIVWQ